MEQYSCFKITSDDSLDYIIQSLLFNNSVSEFRCVVSGSKVVANIASNISIGTEKQIYTANNACISTLVSETNKEVPASKPLFVDFSVCSIISISREQYLSNYGFELGDVIISNKLDNSRDITERSEEDDSLPEINSWGIRIGLPTHILSFSCELKDIDLYYKSFVNKWFCVQPGKIPGTVAISVYTIVAYK